MNKQRLRQFSVSFLIVLSLFVSSVAACVCAHHTENVEIPSCHTHSERAQSNETDLSENVQNLAADKDCCCIQPAPRVFSKSETIKIEKQSAVLFFSKVEIKTVVPIVSDAGVYFEKSFYLSDSFYNIKSPRAPPRS